MEIWMSPVPNTRTMRVVEGSPYGAEFCEFHPPESKPPAPIIPLGEPPTPPPRCMLRKIHT
eukprot:12040427-Ditylum_brightwellii.AAC.1